MAKETQKAKIERLEKELAEKAKNIQKLKNENNELNIKVANKICENMDLKERLKIAEHFTKQNNIDMLTIRATKRGIRIEELEKEIQELKSEKKNERGAGRKAKLNDKKEEIKQLRLEGAKINELATKYNCSVGLIHKLINE